MLGCHKTDDSTALIRRYWSIELQNFSWKKNTRRKALEIIVKYHPAFRCNASSIHMPAREKTLRIADDLAKELGYNNAISAVNDVLG